MQQKLESGSDDSGCVRSIKLCSILVKFLYCVETKEYCERKGTLENLLYQDETFWRILGE